MISFPNAKINLGLHITSKRADGYHNIDSCFYPIPLYDVLEIIEANETRLNTSGLDIDGSHSDNLIWKAYNLLKQDYDLSPLEIHLLKKIPMGAGMGGGSADGAFMLKLLNDHFKLGFNTKELEKYALQLGSDCPFFVENTAKHVTGRGEIMEPIDLDLKGYWLALIYPGIHISTKEAYSGIMPDNTRTSVKEIIEKEPIENWNSLLANDFENTAFKNHPELASYKNKLYELGAKYAAMTGSGSTMFGLFKEKVNYPKIDKWLEL